MALLVLPGLSLAAPASVSTGSAEPASGGWEGWVKVALATVAGSVIGVIFNDAIKALLKKVGQKLEVVFERVAPFRIRRYLLALGEDHQWLKLIGVSNRVDLHPPRLKKVYISLRLAASRAEEAQRVGWEKVLGKEEDQRRVVLLGSPGAGKSTLLDYLVLVFTGLIPRPEPKAMGSPLPFYGRLRQLGTPDRANLSELLARSGPVHLPPDLVEHRLSRGGCLVLLDGLDEVLDQAQQARVLEDVRRLSHLSRRNWIVLTCRIAGWQDNWLPGFRVFEVQELDRDDIRQFIGAWYREVLRTERVNALGGKLGPVEMEAAERAAYEKAQGKVAELWGALENNEGLLRLAATPLLLSLMALVHYRLAKLPKERGTLFDHCLQILLELWEERDKELKVRRTLSTNQTRRALQLIAFRFLTEGRVEASLAELDRDLAPLFQEIATAVPVGDWVRQIEERSGILVEPSVGRYAFAHRALHDYLVAEHIVAYELDGLLVENAGEERWREVILIAAGKVSRPRAERLLGALLHQTGDGTAALEMAGRCLAEEIQVGPDIRAEVRRKLLDRLDREEAGGTWARLLEALRVSNAEAFVSWLAAQLRERSGSSLGRLLSVASGLTEEAGRPLVPTLTELLMDAERSGEERALAALALGRWPSLGSDPIVLAVLRSLRPGGSPALRRAAIWTLCELGRFADMDLDLVKVPAGEFLMGSQEKGEFADESPQHTLFLPTFYIAREPVTEVCYRRFWDWRGKPSRGVVLKALENHPVVSISWYEALSFAEDWGGTLPSEAEWEKAARGVDGRSWPWGDDWAAGRANTAEGQRAAISRVGAYSPQGDSPFGCRDMAGNVWEWTRSLWGTDLEQPDFANPYVISDGRENLEAGDAVARVLRGGSYHNSSRSARCAARSRDFPIDRFNRLGFRVVVRPP